MTHNWPKEHVRLFVLSAVALVLLILVYIFGVLPLARKVSDDRNYIASTRRDLEKKDWPLEPDRLKSLLEMKRRALNGSGKADTVQAADGLEDKSRLMLQRCTRIFDERIAKYFTNAADFPRDISRLDFQDEFNSFEEKSNQRGVFFSEQLLHLSEKSSSPFTYQLVLQVWTLDRLCELALDSGLRFRSDPEIRDVGGRRAAAMLQVLPVRSYTLYRDGEIFVLEFPVRMGLRGRPEQLYRFLMSLQADGCFLPVSRLQATAVPGFKDDEKETAFGIGALDIDVECSSFYRQPDEGPKIKQKKSIKLLPAGA